mgnify:CR=1 FL=1
MIPREIRAGIRSSHVVLMPEWKNHRYRDRLQAFSKPVNRKGWLGLSGANPQFSTVWGLPSVDPSHPQERIPLRTVECVAVFYGANCEDYVSWVNLDLVAWWLPAVIVSQEGYPMPLSPRVSKEKYVESVRAEMEDLLGEVMEAVNAAPGGRVIVDSEEQVRQLMHEFRQRAYERAVQLRADSAESAFPPSEE